MGKKVKATARRHRGGNRWYWQARIPDPDRPGKRITVWTGTGTVEEATQAIAAELAAGLPALHHSEAPPAVKTVGDLIDHWLKHQRRRRDIQSSTKASYHTKAGHVVAWLRPVLLDNVDRRIIERYRANRLAEQEEQHGRQAPRSVSAELDVLRMAWSWGRDCGHAPPRSFPSVKVKTDGYVVNHHTPTRADVDAALGHLAGLVRLAVLTLAETGARVGEVVGATVADLDTRTGTLTLRGKTGERAFPIAEHADLYAQLRGLASDRDPDALLFPFDVAHPGAKIRHALTGACEAAEVERFTPHGLRRMVVTHYRQKDVPVDVAAELFGHSIEVMLRIYNEVGDADLRGAVRRAIGGQPDPEAGENVYRLPQAAEEGA